MEFPKRLYVILDQISGEPADAKEAFEGLPKDLLVDGAEVAVYKFARIKKVQVTRRLVSANPAEPDQDDENELPAGVNVAAEAGL